LDCLRPELKVPYFSKTTEKVAETPFLLRKRYSQNEIVLRDKRRARGVELYEKVHRLRRAKHTILGIARQLKMSWKQEFLERAPQLFGRDHVDTQETDERIAELESMIGKLTIELDLAKKP